MPRRERSIPCIGAPNPALSQTRVPRNLWPGRNRACLGAQRPVSRPAAHGCLLLTGLTRPHAFSTYAHYCPLSRCWCSSAVGLHKQEPPPRRGSWRGQRCGGWAGPADGLLRPQGDCLLPRGVRSQAVFSLEHAKVCVRFSVDDRIYLAARIPNYVCLLVFWRPKSRT